MTVYFLMQPYSYSQCHWLLYSHENLCRDNLHYISNCRVRISTNVYCNNFLNQHLAMSSIYIVNNTALASTVVFYNNIQNIYPLCRSHSLLNPISFFHLPKIFTIIPSVTEPLVLSTQPQRLQLSNPAKCNNDYTACNISGITLGKDIRIQANIVGYNDKPSEPPRFFVELL